jgi:hypothetical protein
MPITAYHSNRFNPTTYSGELQNSVMNAALLAGSVNNNASTDVTVQSSDTPAPETEAEPDRVGTTVTEGDQGTTSDARERTAQEATSDARERETTATAEADRETARGDTGQANTSTEATDRGTADDGSDTGSEDEGLYGSISSSVPLTGTQLAGATVGVVLLSGVLIGRKL